MRVTVSTGPGAHSHHLIAQLVARRALSRVFYYWPRAEVSQLDCSNRLRTIARLTWHDQVTRFAWGLWRRMSGGGDLAPTAFLYPLYDKAMQRFESRCDVFVGWSQVSLYTLGRARRDGAVTVLEHPMVHVRTWMETMRREYARFGHGARSRGSVFPGSIVRRMLMEYGSADRINVLSSFARQTFLDAGVPGDRIMVTLPGVDVDVFRPASGGDGVFRILYVGRMELLKGVHHLLRAFAELALPGAELWLIGKLLPEMEPYFRRYAGSFRHLPERGPAELADAYRRASVFVLPSIHEGFGLVLLEAMASGVPVIATRTTGGPDAVRDGATGFLTSPGDVDALKERLTWLYGHPAARREMGDAGRETALAHFTWDHYGDRVEANLRSLLASRQAAAS
jgi:glycosyltransferase involved in cell wall biosynthesis